MNQVLVIDDDAMARAATSHVLKKANYEVLTAADGAEALQILRNSNCRIVVTDWEMPVMDGLALCRAIRARQFRGYVYVIILSSHQGAQDTLDGLAAGADDYVTKPFNPAELIMRVKTGERIIGVETRDMAIFAMAKLAESRDAETGAHLERVRTYCRRLAEQLHQSQTFPDDIDEQFVELIYQTSPLHDIGKVAIPDCVLLKSGQLIPREYEIMMQHTLAGAATLQAALDEYPNARFLQMARDIALTHHERFDGKGYPHGLAGDDIPLCGRIVAVADVYDALTSKRVYKDAYGHDVARSIIVKDSGAHFDPRVVEAFLACEDAFAAMGQWQTGVLAAAH